MKTRFVAALFLGIAVLVLSIFVACTENQRAKTFGGTMTVNLPAGQKLINATWKEEDLWYLIRPMRAGEVPEEALFKEDSSFGILKGTVVFKESK
jgi:hypothetical protein